MEVVKHILICVFIKTCLVQSQIAKDRKVCNGTKHGIVYLTGVDIYSKYRDRYAGCKVIEGNLEIITLMNSTVEYDLSFLKEIEEVTGYVLIYGCYAEVFPLTNLRIIRGRTTYSDESSKGQEFALFIASNYADDQSNKGLREIQLKSLTEISLGNVFIRDNKFLCHIETIDWKQIISESNTINISTAQQCSPCASECMGRCWSAQPDMCQKMTRNCSADCSDRCFGPHQGQCCRPECAAGCTGPHESQCFACRSFQDENRCVLSCPPPHIYNASTAQRDPNPNVKFMYRSQCLKKCPVEMSEEYGACVAHCKPGYIEGHDGKCVQCNGSCPKYCGGTFEGWIAEHNIESFKDCIVVRGNIKILQSTFSRSFQVNQLSALKHVKEITGYLAVDADHLGFTNLSFFRDLEIIRGQQLFNGKDALKIFGSSLVSLNLNSLKEIHEGNVLVHNNPNLCFVNSINWRKLFRRSHQLSSIFNNRNTSSCELESLICSDQCDSNGCMGSGRNECLQCANVHYKGVCIESCSAYNAAALYLPNSQNSNECSACHEQCLFNCSGPGADQCWSCKNFQNQQECVSSCPLSKYPNELHVCTDCSATCDGGCTGPGKNLGPGGCNSCHLLLLDTDGVTVLECLPEDEEAKTDCFNFRLLNRSSENGLGLKGKASCQKCAHLPESQKCVGKCLPNFFRHHSQCIRCHELCRTCDGPTQHHCLSCSQFKIYDDFENRQNGAKFNCSNECPPSVPELIYEKQEEICAPEEFIQQNKGRQLAIVFGTVISGFVFLGIVILLILILRRQLAKTEEKKLQLTAKLTGIVECEPITPSNTKPDMSVLRLIKESELRRRNIIGSGAFGTVYKGFWIPEGDNVKIPVAIKVLQEESGQNESLLEEARIMTSVDHPCCVRILAVCMTAKMMLVTQLMPLGCLLEYVQKNKDNIGSKILLNWCTQIAKGMAYLEERGIIHRDLAARNVLVQSSYHVKITDFGLSKIVNKDERFQESSGKWPIKWLALECIQHKIFTHKSDVWSFGITVWELCTFGQRPYDGISARNVVDLLEKGERLPQPSICTIDVYMIMIKCWMLDADSRPTFYELSKEFAKMARDPGRYLVVQNDAALHLASTSVTTKDLLKFMSLDSNEVCENIISGDDYINHLERRKSSLLLQNAKGKVFSKDETKTETAPLLRLNIPRRSVAQGKADPGLESPRYSPDPLSLTQSIPFPKPPSESRDSSATGASTYQLPEKPQKPSSTRVQPVNSSDYIQPVVSPGDCPAYLELEYESVGGTPQEKSNEESESEIEKTLELKKNSLPPTITVTNPEYFK